MSRIAYVNGRYVPHRDAAVHVEDRGYQFADGVYEVMAVVGGRIVDEEPHLDRLDRSLGELRIPRPMTRAALKLVMRELLRRNGIEDGMIYVQISRGVAPRDHGFPKRAAPSIVMTARRARPGSAAAQQRGVSVITIPDIRWRRCDIKTIALLPNVLGRQQALEQGAYEAWLVDDAGCVTEGTASNAWIVTAKGELATRHTDMAILSGVTRAALLAKARAEGFTPVERPFTVEEARQAREAFMTSTTGRVVPVVRIDGIPVGRGEPGPLTRKLQAVYARHLGVAAAA